MPETIDIVLRDLLHDPAAEDPIQALAILTSHLWPHLPTAKATQLREAYELVLKERERHQAEIAQLTTDNDSLTQRISDVEQEMATTMADNARFALDDKQLRTERLMLAKLSSETPQFFNPLAAMAAVRLRDRVLADEGTPE